MNNTELTKEELRFVPMNLMRVVIITHIVCYLTWAFVEFSLTIPILKTFTTKDGRIHYIIFVLVSSLLWFPYYVPFVKIEKYEQH